MSAVREKCRFLARLSFCVLVAGCCYSQPATLTEIERESDNLDYPPTEARELSVLRETLSTEEIDRAVLNRLLAEIGRDPERTMNQLALEETQIDEIFITLSNARGFINGSEMANVRAMCANWNESGAIGTERIEQALAAYSAREKATKTFIAKYYAVVLLEIEALLNDQSKALFEAYMIDRRARMANAGATSWGSPVQNIRAGTDTISFHCR